MVQYSISPTRTRYSLPTKKESELHIDIIKKLVFDHRKKGRKIIVVQGLGFVGAINAAVIADTKRDRKNPYFVIGIDLPNKGSFWKIATINNGDCPYISEDPKVDIAYKRTVLKQKNFIATWLPEVFSFADIILVDINLDVEKKELGKAKYATVPMEPFKKAIESIGRNMNPKSLVLIETTVPPGTTKRIVEPIIRGCLARRGFDLNKYPPNIAHSYERIMPGKDYVDSVRNIWRTYSGINDKSKKMTREFLETIGNTKEFPIWELETTEASEMAKVLENSYRAMNIAFIHEWTKMAEDIGVNLFEVVKSIKVRRGTHDNMMYPGFGVGGYCLTKDPLLAQWSSAEIFQRRESLGFSVNAIDINDLMPDHTFNLLMKGLKGKINNKKIAILGASYRKDIDDTRSSPTIRLYDRIIDSGGRPFIHDPYATTMIQREDIRIYSDLKKVLKDSTAIILVVDHGAYLKLTPEELIRPIKKNGSCVVDAFNILNNEKIIKIKKAGILVLGVGKGHIENL